MGNESIRIRFFENPNGKREILTSRGVYDHINKLQHEGVALAKAAVPRDTGRLQDGIKGEVIEKPTGIVGRIKGTDFKTLWFEKGSSKVRARHMLTGALEKQGLRVRRTAKGEASNV